MGQSGCALMFPHGDVEMPYKRYRGDALEAIGQAMFFLLEDQSKVYTSPWEHAQEVFLWYVSTYPDSELACFQEQYGARFQQDLHVLWPVFLCDLSQGQI